MPDGEDVASRARSASSPVGDRALGHHHGGEVPAAVAPGHQAVADRLERERDLGHQDLGGPPGQPGVEGDVAHVAAHDLADHDPVVGLRRGLQAVDGVGGDLHRRVEPEGDLGPRQVVVDGLGQAHHGKAQLEEAPGRTQGVVAPDGHHGVEALAAAVASTRWAPSSVANGLVRDDPRMVPPWVRMPRQRSTSSSTASFSIAPRQPSRNPTDRSSNPTEPPTTTARIAAFNPGSPRLL